MSLNRCRSSLLLLFALLICLSISRDGYAQNSLSEAAAKPLEAKIFQTPVDNQHSDSSLPPQNTPVPSNNSLITPGSPALAPMTANEKITYGFKKAFFSPSTYFFPAIRTVQQQLTEDEPDFKDTGDKVADGFSRYAINFATASSKALFVNGVYPAVFRQDPRYVPSGKRGFKARALYAITRIFVTTGDNGRTQFNASLIGGDLTAATMANAWERNTPEIRRIGVTPTFIRFGNMLILDTIKTVLFKEFGADIKHKILRK